MLINRENICVMTYSLNMGNTNLDKPRQLCFRVQVAWQCHVDIKIQAYFSNKDDYPWLLVFRLMLQQQIILITESRWPYFIGQEHPCTDPLLSQSKCYPMSLASYSCFDPLITVILLLIFAFCVVLYEINGGNSVTLYMGKRNNMKYFTRQQKLT